MRLNPGEKLIMIVIVIITLAAIALGMAGLVWLGKFIGEYLKNL